MSIEVRLDGAALERAQKLADETYATFAAARGYYRNTPSSHLLGKIGEMAVEEWLRGEGLDSTSLFSTPEHMRAADLEVHGIRIEVKTWDQRWWPAWGRCVAVGQVQALQQKCDCIVWVTVDRSTTPTAHIQGWSTMSDVVAAQVLWTGPEGRKVQNHQLAPEQLRDSQDLLDRLQRRGATG